MRERRKESTDDIALRLYKPFTPITKEEDCPKMATNAVCGNVQPQSVAQARSRNDAVMV